MTINKRPKHSTFKLTGSEMKKDYNKTQQVLMLIKEIVRTPNNMVNDSTFRAIMGDPSKANYHRIIKELTTDQGELLALIKRIKIEDDFYYSLNESYTGVKAASMQEEFMLECYSRLGSVLPDEMQKRLSSIVDQKMERSRNLDRKFCHIKPVEGHKLSAEQKRNLSVIIKAILEEKEVRITYVDSKKNKSEFLMRPFTLSLYREDLYLLGERLKNREYEYKNCKIRRIVSVELTENKFTYPLGRIWDPKRDFELSSGIINARNENFEVQINVYGESRNVFREKRFFNNKLILSEEHFDSYELICTNINEFLGQLFIYAQDIEVITEGEIKKRFLEKAEKAILRNQKNKSAA